MLKVKFEMETLHEAEAKAIVSMLVSRFGVDVVPYAEVVKVGDVSRSITRPDTVQPPADNNHIVEGSERFPEPDAAAAFAGNTAEYLAVHAEEPDAAAAFGGNAPSAPTAAPTGERDSAGIPWDERIHSSTKGKNKDGTWSRRRNTPDQVFDGVMAELKAANTSRTGEAAQGAGLVPPPVPAPPTTSPVPSPPPVAPAASSPAPAGSLIDPKSPTAFPDIMRLVTSSQTAGKVTTEQVGNLLLSLGVDRPASGGLPSIAVLLSRSDLIPSFHALLLDHLAMQG